MVFASEKYYNLTPSDFLNRERSAAVFLGGFLTDGKLSPLDGSAIDKNKQRAYLKAYSEHAERALLNAYHKHQQVQALNVITGDIETCPSSDFAYQDETGRRRNDTTGTSAGINAPQMIEKSVWELLEKNELMLWWYARRGYKLPLTGSIIQQAEQLGLQAEQLTIFVCQNLCNRPTVIVTLTNDKRLLSNGIALSDSFETSLQLALEEAKLLKLANDPAWPSAVLSQIDSDTHLATVRHIQSLWSTLDNYQIKETQANANPFQTANFITDLRVKLINQGLGNKPATIKCISNQLLNYLPKKRNLALDTNLSILIHHGITVSEIEKAPDCILL